MESQRKQQIYRNLMVAISNNKKYSTQNFVCYQVSNLFLFYQNFCLNVSYFLVFEKFSFFFSWIVPIYSGKIELLPTYFDILKLNLNLPHVSRIYFKPFLQFQIKTSTNFIFLRCLTLTHEKHTRNANNNSKPN